MTYAIIRLQGAQFKVSEGDTLKVPHAKTLDCDVLLYKDEKSTIVGSPLAKGVSVELSKVEDKKDTKVMVARFTAKSRHRRKVGHRQPVSILKVGKILLGEGTPEVKASPKKRTVKKVVSESEEE